ncbi:winged helix-turn-helix transcriptional regulator [Candidatus Poribacteria bacterium]|nr:winged helix-turn-helix transcriptional regulator [Candidatus Poribacteria bacterium]
MSAQTERSTDRHEAIGDDTVERMTQLFKAFADPTRLRILNALLHGEAAVGEIAEAVGISVSAASHQLAYLRAIRLVRGRRDGRSVRYSLDDLHVREVFATGRRHVEHD